MAGAVDVEAADADQAMQRYEAMTRVTSPRCQSSGGADEIVVCGRHDPDRFRLPLPEERHVAGERGPRGEVAAASAAPIRTGSCGTLATDTCGGGLPVIGAAMLLAKAAGKLIDPDAE